MKRKQCFNILITGIILCILFLSSCSKSETGLSRNNSGKPDKAESFVLKDLSGTSISLPDFLGQRGALLVFTTTWCPHCITSIPDLKRIHNNLKDKGFYIVAIYIKEPNSRVAEFRDKYELPYRILLDSDGAVAAVYDIRGVPTFILIDGDGNTQYNGYRVPEDLIDNLVVQ
jgi:peroxiredoxin